MTWEELKEKAKETHKEFYSCLGKSNFGVALEDCTMYFWKDGSISVEFDIGRRNCGGLDIILNRTYDQMYQIMLVLR